MPPMTVNGPTPAARRAHKLARRAAGRPTLTSKRPPVDAATGLPLTKQHLKTLRANPRANVKMSKKHVRRAQKLGAALRASPAAASPVDAMADD